MGITVFLGAFLLHGCGTITCACSEPWEEITMHVRDAKGPAEGVRIAIFRADDGTLIDSAVNEGHAYEGNGVYPVFHTYDRHRVAGGDSILAIRVLATRGDDSGEASITVRTRYALRKLSGPDTIHIR